MDPNDNAPNAWKGYFLYIRKNYEKDTKPQRINFNRRSDRHIWKTGNERYQEKTSIIAKYMKVYTIETIHEQRWHP